MSEKKVKKERKEKKNATEAAKKLLIAEQQKRINKCNVQMKALLEKHKCTFEVSMTIFANRNVPQVRVVSL